MRRIFFLLILSLLPVTYSYTYDINSERSVDAIADSYRLYNEMGLEDTLNFDAFDQAVKGYAKIEGKKKDIITIIDFTKPSTEKRLYVIDLQHKKLLFASHVSHGKNSGENYATSFSNINGSHQSSLGFFLTEETYYGKNGYSLKLEGLEKGVNDKAKERAIVVHGAKYSNPSVINGAGRLGRSFGCPALPTELAKPIINTIKDGSVLYIYANNKDYIAQSSVLSAADIPSYASLKK